MSALQLQIRPPLMRSCPSDPEEEEDGGGVSRRALDSAHEGRWWWWGIQWEIHSGSEVTCVLSGYIR